MFDLVMCDLDGTLVDTAPEIANSVDDFLRAHHLPAAGEMRVRRWIGHGTRELLRQALEQSAEGERLMGAEVSDTLMSTFFGYYFANCGRNSSVFPGVPETLRELRSAGVKLAVVSNKEERFARPVLDAHGLSELFDLCVFGDSLPAKKPDPLPLLHCLRQFGITAERALMVGDSEIDVATARNASVAVWAVPYGYNHGKPIEQCGPDRIISNFSALLESLPKRKIADFA